VEYMAAKLPIIVSDGGGNCEAIGHEAEGLIFSVGKAQELSSSIRRLLTDAALASRLAENARSKAIRLYDRRTFIANHENFYEHVLSRKRPRATSS
jgi:glycosyltransferase involved in cell wall biosynthesis